ncbi:acyl carrier protein [Zooshikella ganghwensis]|uniref:Acyl carrier protein n=1 Tax=Zooshikella ganghwensis TaxID=202772 RepID=A0A4P9VL82_9GAMM|nr:phosphopantetheine-binding protein [Zooshikella ganghwensis]RDH44108.1 acyl carrier protein [Zooshikella ganghwensis]
MKDKAALTHFLLEQIKAIAPDSDTDDLDPDEDMREELDLDSMDFLRLLESIAKQLNINIPEMDYNKITTLNTMVSYLSERQSSL